MFFSQDLPSQLTRSPAYVCDISYNFHGTRLVGCLSSNDILIFDALRKSYPSVPSSSSFSSAATSCSSSSSSSSSCSPSLSSSSSSSCSPFPSSSVCQCEWIHTSTISQAHCGLIRRCSWAHPEFGQIMATCADDKMINLWTERRSARTDFSSQGGGRSGCGPGGGAGLNGRGGRVDGGSGEGGGLVRGNSVAGIPVNNRYVSLGRGGGGGGGDRLSGASASSSPSTTGGGGGPISSSSSSSSTSSSLPFSSSPISAWSRAAQFVHANKAVTSVQFGPREFGLCLAACSRDGFVRIYSTADNLMLDTWEVHELLCYSPSAFGCTCLSWNLNINHPSQMPLLAVGGADGTIKILGRPTWISSSSSSSSSSSFQTSSSWWRILQVVVANSSQLLDLSWAPNVVGRSWEMLASCGDASSKVCLWRWDFTQADLQAVLASTSSSSSSSSSSTSGSVSSNIGRGGSSSSGGLTGGGGGGTRSRESGGGTTSQELCTHGGSAAAAATSIPRDDANRIIMMGGSGGRSGGEVENVMIPSASGAGEVGVSLIKGGGESQQQQQQQISFSCSTSPQTSEGANVATLGVVNAAGEKGREGGSEDERSGDPHLQQQQQRRKKFTKLSLLTSLECRNSPVWRLNWNLLGTILVAATDAEMGVSLWRVWGSGRTLNLVDCVKANLCGHLPPSIPPKGEEGGGTLDTTSTTPSFPSSFSTGGGMKMTNQIRASALGGGGGGLRTFRMQHPLRRGFTPEASTEIAKDRREGIRATEERESSGGRV